MFGHWAFGASGRLPVLCYNIAAFDEILQETA